MKIILLKLTVIIFFMSVFQACKTDKPVHSSNDIVYDSISVSQVYHLDNDSTKPSCSLKIRYIYLVKYADTTMLAKVQGELNFVLMEDEKYEKMSPVDGVNTYVTDYIENYKRDAKEQFPDWENSGDSEDYFSYYKTLDSKILYDMSGILSYQVSSMDYKGGANSSTAYRNVVIDLKTGNMLNEQDIFKSDYKKALNSILVHKIVEQNKVQKPDDLLDFGYWGIEDVSSNNNFFVDDKGITYIINPGEYSAPSLGEIKIFLSYAEVENILKDDSPISVLFRK
ncbi:MAG: RsiV family protein [Dysgonomonas sp.]